MTEVKPLTGLDSLIDQEHPVRNLAAVISRGNIPHAFLFTGIEGSGKRTAALTFALVCNCRENNEISSASNSAAVNYVKTNACGRCRSCRKILSGHHPDIITVSSSGNFIKISQIRDLCSRLAVKPYDSGYRFVIICDAGSMNKEAGNALLKMLEEPPGRTVIILTASQKLDLLPTVVSRCRHIQFRPVSESGIRMFLRDIHKVDDNKAAVIASMAGGSLSRALEMNQDELLNLREWLLNEIRHLSLRRMGICLALAERFSEKKELVQYFLDIIRSWFRDLMVCKYAPDKIANQDLADQVMNASKETETDILVARIEAINEAGRKIMANANQRLTLEILFLQLAGIKL